MGNYIVYVGRHQTQSNNPHESSHSVSRVVIPSSYVESYKGQDVALVQLSTPITWSDYASPVCLPSSDTQFSTDMQCYVTGWGNTKEDGKTFIKLCQIFNKVPVLLVSKWKCVFFVWKYNFI